jgi:poly-gamma-glutamate synthesis protein (capsule biosynthesis protein)
MLVSQHNHHYPGVERPNDFKQLLLSQLPARLAPPAWLEPWARRLVDEGADVVALHGPPLLLGLEIYKEKPIFYSLGNFIFQVPPESIHLEEPILWESVVANLNFDGRELRSIRFQPIAMNKIGKGLPNPHDQFDVNEYHLTRGFPRPAMGDQARFLLERFALLSKPFGTELDIKDGIAELKGRGRSSTLQASR